MKPKYQYAKEYGDGWQAAFEGSPIESRPKYASTPQALAWKEGWTDSKEGKIDAKKFLGQDFVTNESSS